jgi:hypothetical protein
MNRMTRTSRTAACLVAAVLLLAACSPSGSRAVCIDAVAFEVNKPQVQVVVRMPLGSSGCAYQDDDRMYLVCDVHLGQGNGHAGRRILKQQLLTTERYTMLLTVTSEGRSHERDRVGFRVSADIEAPAFVRRLAATVAAIYAKVASMLLKALIALLRCQIS